MPLSSWKIITDIKDQFLQPLLPLGQCMTILSLAFRSRT